MTPTQVPPDELEDALALVEAKGLPRDEFKFTAVENVPGFGPVKVLVTAERKGLAAVQYEAGHGTTWLAAFEESLKGGTFQ